MSKKNKKKEYLLFKVDEESAQNLGLATGLFPEQLKDNFCLATEKGKIYEENDMAILYKPTNSGKTKLVEVNNVAEAYAFFVERISQISDSKIIIQEPKLEKTYKNPIEKIKYNKVSDALMYTTDIQQILAENDSFGNELESLNNIYKQARKNLKDATKKYEAAKTSILASFLTNIPHEASLETLSYDERDDYFSDDEEVLEDDYEEEEEEEDSPYHSYE